MKKKKVLIGILISLIIIAIAILIIFIHHENSTKEIEQIQKENTFPYLLQDNCEIIEKDISKGMTIKDSYGNEWVWIVVPKDKVFRKASNNKDYDNIERDIKEYTKEYSSDQYSDIIVEYKELKEKTLESIYTYGGFWISRYEIGTDSVRDLKTENETVPYSKANMYLYNYVNFEQAEELSTKISNGDYKSNLLFGFQWDLVCKFIEENGYTYSGEKITVDMLNENSTLWGNYYSSSFILNRGKYTTDYGKTYVEVSGNEIKKSYRNYLFTTGASEENKACNIYDFAGNASEWTLEKYMGDEKNINTIRDGSFYFNYGGNDPVNGRFNLDANSTNANYGFRVAVIK